jgi:hypothetical protein
MHFTGFTLMPYRPLDMEARHKERSAWVVLPNSLYDPIKGADEYESHISLLTRAEDLGFDAIAVNGFDSIPGGTNPDIPVVAPLNGAVVIGNQPRRRRGIISKTWNQMQV